jgi:hypothetical protein
MTMSDVQDYSELDALQNAYKAALEHWIATIRAEEALVCVNHTLAEVDRWEQSHFDEEDARDRAKEAKQDYENALREKFFDF